MKVSLTAVSVGSLSKFCILASLAFWAPIAFVAGAMAFANPTHVSPGGSDFSWGAVAFVFYVFASLLAALVNGAFLFAGAMLLRLMGRRAPSLLIDAPQE